LHFSLPEEGSWFIKLAFFLPENGTLLPKSFGDVHLIFILIKTVHLFGVINGVL